MNTNTKYFSHRRAQQTTPRSNQTGLTLIEIMVAITISLLLLGGLIQIVVGNKQTYKVQDAMARVQENGRFSLHFLSKDVRMAGFMGCSNPSGGLSVNNNVDPSEFTASGVVGAAVGGFDGANAIQGYSYTGTLSAELSAMGLTSGSNEGDLIDNTDILFIRRATSCPGGAVISHNNNAATMFIEDNSTCGIQQNDIVMISNCQTADIFGVTNDTTTGQANNITHAANLNISPQLANGYGADSYIYLMKSEVYFIGVGASGQPALFKRELRVGNMVSNELVEGVENMTVLYGEDRDNDGAADTYVDAASVLVMDNVVSLRITMGIRSLEDNIATATNNGDRRIRRTYSTTIGIRNRMS